MRTPLVAGALLGFTCVARAVVIGPDRIEAAFGVDVAVLENGDVTIAADGREVEEVRLVWERAHASTTRICRNDWERDYAEAGWTALTNNPGSAWYFLIREGRRIDGWGVATQPNALCWWTVSETNIVLTLDVRAGGAPLRLGSRVLTAARLVMREGREDESAYVAGRAFCRMMCPNPRLPKAPVYGYNDWYCAYGKNTATNFLADAAFVTSLAAGLENRPYVVMDDGWQPNAPPVVKPLGLGSSGWGPWDRSGDAFGMAMKPFAAAVAALGAKPGLWYRPYRAWAEAPSEQKLRDHPLFFDPTAPGVRERFAADIARFRDWGFKLVKIDYLVGDVAGALSFPRKVGGMPVQGNRGWRDVSRTTAEVLLDHYRAMRAAAGDDVVLIGCNGFDHLIAGLFELQRIGGDTSGWRWEQTKEMGVNSLGARAIHDGTFYAADADCVGLARAGAVDWRQNRQWLDLVSRSGTPLFISWRRSLMTDDIRDEFRRAFRAASERHATAEPLSWECEAFPTRWRFADGSTVAYDWDLTNETSRCQADGPPPAPGVEDWGFRKEIAAGVDALGLAAIPPDSEPWLENRISRCFFGPIKRPPFNRDELMDDIDYYPDAYLAQLRDEGVNGLWLTIEFRDLVETSFNHRHPTAARRLGKLRRTVEKCAKYGIGVWVFAIEPRCGDASPEFYAANTNLFVKAYWPPCDDWDHLMCPSLAETRRYLKEALKDLFAEVPGLKGFINIAYGERWTTCLSQFPCCAKGVPRPQLCPRCARRQPWEVLNDILVPMRDGIREGNPDAGFICWFYMPEPCVTCDEWIYDCVRHFPKGVTFQMNFESGIVGVQEGKPRVGGDYWLSQPGPSGIFRRLADVCRGAGTRLSAKIQVSSSHEMATIPHVPVPGLLYRKFKAMRECGVKDAMYCWYFGCNPGLMNRAAGMLSCEDFSDGEDAFLDRLARVEWGEDAPRVARLWKTFAAAYGNYPLSNMMQYYGPFHDGVVWELHPLLDLKPLSRSWKCDRADGDTIGECLEGFSLDEARRLADAMCASLYGCFSELDALAAKYANDVRRSREIGVMKAFVILCRGGRDVLAFYQARRDAVRASRVRRDGAEALRYVAEMRRLAESARGHSAAMIPLCERDSRLGYHPESETYKFNPETLRKRIGDIDRVVRELDGIEREIAAGRPYPKSDFELSAPVWNAVRREDGQVVVEGLAASGRTDAVRIDLYDETGSEYPMQITANVEGGLFRAVLPKGDWRWIHVSRPGLSDMPTVGESVPERLKLGRAAVRNCARLVTSADETAKWQAAIDSVAAAGGGVVNVPAGEHLVGGLVLKSNVELHLERGATLLAAAGLDHYRIVKCPYSEGDWSAVVMGLNITNAAITGEGVIHGRGGKWPAPTEKDYSRGHQESLRARGMFFYQSKGIRLEDFTLKDAACWGIVLKECDGVVARKVTIDSHANHNNDGFDIESKNVLIEDCVADSGDDSFVIKSSNPDFVCENITVRRCTARGQANAFKIGTATRGIVRNVRFENVRCEDATRVCTELDDGTPTKLLAYHSRCKIGGRTPHGCMLNAVCFACVDGGCVENITVDGLDIAGGVLMPFYIRSDFRKKGMESGAVAPGKRNKLRNIRISNVRGCAMGPVASAIMGAEGFHVENVALKDIDLEIEGAGEDASRAALETPVPSPNGHYPSGDQFYPHIFPAYGLYIDRVDGLTMENVRFRLVPGTDDVRPPVCRQL